MLHLLIVTRWANHSFLILLLWDLISSIPKTLSSILLLPPPWHQLPVTLHSPRPIGISSFLIPKTRLSKHLLIDLSDTESPQHVRQTSPFVNYTWSLQEQISSISANLPLPSAMNLSNQGLFPQQFLIKQTSPLWSLIHGLPTTRKANLGRCCW